MGEHIYIVAYVSRGSQIHYLIFWRRYVSYSGDGEEYTNEVVIGFDVASACCLKVS